MPFLCLSELNFKRLEYKNISASLLWNQDFAIRAMDVANPWTGHRGLGDGVGGFVTGQVEAAGFVTCKDAVYAWVDNEMTSPGICVEGVSHCSIILDPSNLSVGCGNGPGLQTVCNFGN